MAYQFSHNELARAIEAKFPGMKHGLNFWVGHPVKNNSDEQIGEAFIAAWNSDDIPKPDPSDLAKER